MSNKRNRLRKAGEKNKERDEENEEVAPLKIHKGEKVSVSKSITVRMMEDGLDPTHFVFLPETGSDKHCNIPWFVNRNEAKSIWTPLIYNISELRKLPFGCTRYTPKEGGTPAKNFTCAIPIAPNVYKEDQHLSKRIEEVQSVLQAYLLSPEAAAAWAQVGLEQPDSVEGLNFTPLINIWKPKRTGETFTEIRVKFTEGFSGEVEWTCTDYRVEGRASPTNIATIGKGDMLKGTVRFGVLYIRPTPRSKTPFITGVTLEPVNIEIHANPESVITFVE